MRLLKLMAAGLVAYAAYELYQGLIRRSEGSPATAADQERERIGTSPDSPQEYPDRTQASPAHFEGMDVATVDASGGSSHTRVGRGVVQRG